MVTFRSLASRLSALIQRREWNDRVDEELEFHIGMEIEENIRRGMTPLDARAAALRNLGNRTQVCEEVHRMNTIAFLEETAGNVRISLRTLRRNPGFALTAVLVLALGLGASTAMFSALDRILFRPLPYADADRLVNVGWTMPAFGNSGKIQVFLASRGFRERWRPAPEPFTAMTTIENVGGACDITEGQPERLRCSTVESNFLQTLGVRPALGRDLRPEDNIRGAPPVAIISHELWTRRFGANPGVVGREFNLNGKPVPVIGVLPDGFAMPAGEADILQPYPLEPPGSQRQSLLTAFARLKPGVTPEQAKGAIAPLVEENSKEIRIIAKDQGQPRVVLLRDYMVGDATRLAWLLLGAVAGLLLIACVNVANLILARMAARDREFVVRSALGAGRFRLVRLALTESLLLASAGGGLGLLFAAGLLRAFVRLAPSSIPEIDHASLDLRVFAVATLLALATGVVVGIWPALSVLRSRALHYGPRATTAPHPRMRFTLVTTQIALTITMLVSSALLLRTLWNLISVPSGYQSERVLTLNVALNGALYPTGSRAPFFERLLERIRTIPGTAAATMTVDAFPTGLSWMTTNVPVDRRPRDPRAEGPRMRVREVTPGYFQTFGIPILRGRSFEEADRMQAAVILSESSARILFPGQDAIGHTVELGDHWAEVVGVAQEIRNNGPSLEPEPELYFIWLRKGRVVFRENGNIATFAIRTQAGTDDAMAFLKQAVADLDPRLPVTPEPLNDQVARLTERPRFVAWLLSAFAGLALLLAASGLYGVASYLVTQRTRDIGVRIALGATPSDISRQVVREAGRWIAAGAVLGCALAWVGTRAIETQLYGVGSRDPLSWIAALAVLGIALLLAVLRPATRAARVDPMEALRAD